MTELERAKQRAAFALQRYAGKRANLQDTEAHAVVEAMLEAMLLQLEAHLTQADDERRANGE